MFLSATASTLSKAGNAADDLTGWAGYAYNTNGIDYIFVTMNDTIAVYQPPFHLLGNIQLGSIEDV